MRLDGKQICIADDQEDVLDAMATILEDEGAAVIRAVNGQELFTSVTFGKPDCIIADLYMPGCDGFNAIETIRRLSVSCPILVLTGHATEENITRARELGATACMAKPLKADELIDAVVRLIDESPDESPYSFMDKREDKREGAHDWRPDKIGKDLSSPWRPPSYTSIPLRIRDTK